MNINFQKQILLRRSLEVHIDKNKAHHLPNVNNISSIWAPRGLPRFSHSNLKTIWLACVCVIWKEHNNRVFHHKALIWINRAYQTRSNCYLFCVGVMV